MTDSPLTEEQIAQIAREELGTARKPATTTETSTEEKPAGPPKAAPVNVSKRQIEINLLTSKIGREAALEALALGADPQISSEEIAAETARLQAQADQAAADAWAQTPEGRRAAAQAAVETKAERQRLVTASRALLEEDPQLDAALISRLDDDEVLELAGVTEKPEDPNRYEAPTRTEHDLEVERLAQDWWTLAPFQRIERCEELNIDPAEMQARKNASPTIY
jgi:hypothetical protein